MQGKTQIPGLKNSFASIFTDNDVLFGRGRAIEKHPGNRAFRLYIQQYSDEYSQASRAVKSYMLTELLKSVKKRGVRMFKLSESGIWQQADDKDMKLKIGHVLRDSIASIKGSKEVFPISISASAHAELPASSGTSAMGEMLDDIQRAKMERLISIDATTSLNSESRATSNSAPFFSANLDSLQLNRSALQWSTQEHLRKVAFTSDGGAVVHPDFLSSPRGFSNSIIQQLADQNQASSTATIEHISSLHDTGRPPYSQQATTVMEASGILFASAQRLSTLANRQYVSAVGGPQARPVHFDGVRTCHDNGDGAGGPYCSGVDSIFDDLGVDGLSCSGVEAIFVDFVNSDSAGGVGNKSDDTSP